MLKMLFGLIDVIKTIGYFTILLSYKTGQIIVKGLFLSVEVFQKLLTIIWNVLVVINEDLLVFIYDVLRRLSVLAQTFANVLEQLSECALYVCISTKSLLFTIFNTFGFVYHTILDGITKLVTGFVSLVVAVKHLVVLFGSGVWFAVTLIPVFVVYLIMLGTYYVGRAFEEIISGVVLIKNCVFDAVGFFIDVPVESIAGLTICVCLIYTFIKFHMALYSNVTRMTHPVRAALRRHVSQLLAGSNSSGAETENSNSDSETHDEDDNDEDNEPEQIAVCNNEGWRTKTERNRQMLQEETRLCVICMERNKCILAMPCRHMCTCSECNDTLRNYQRTCPICRRFVNYTIHVY